MQLSVIILNYNVRYFLEQCILSVQAALHDLEAEIIVVDNASPDDSVMMVRESFPNVKLIVNEENLGFPKGNNVGVSHAKGKYVCILNPDTVVAEDTFHKLLEFAKHKENLGIVGVRLIDGTGGFLPESKRGLPTPWVSFTRFLGLHRLSKKWFGKYYASHVEQDEEGIVDVLVGAFMFLERDVYNEVGGFDERYFMYGEDIDLSYTIQQLGYDNYYFPETTVLHYKGESTSKDSEYLVRFKQGMDLFYDKYYKGHALFDIFMRIGIHLFSKKKLRQAQEKRKELDSIVFFSRNKEKLSKLQTWSEVPVRQLNTIEDLGQIEERVQLVFDGDAFSNTEIITAMRQFKNRRLTYRIWPKGCNFMLGGDNSDTLGETVLF